ncbi:MAG: glycosyltransferase [Candidatus Altimarinota bacterium]
MEKPKIAIIHDAFLYRGGGERLVTLMAKTLNADLVSGFFSEGSFDPRELGFKGKMISLGKPVFMKGVRHMVLKWRFFWHAKTLRNYDIVIFSGDCLGALKHMRHDSKKLYYCHTPPRYLYDFKERYLEKMPWYIRPVFSLIFSFFSKIYERNLRKFDAIYTNSENVKKRLLEYTGFQSEIIYPPTDTHFFSPGKVHLPEEIPFSSGEYFFSWARLSPPKRVDLVIDAFLELPDRKLIFSYGANDPLKEQILEKISHSENIFAVEAPRDDLLLTLIRGAIASIYIPVDEDFGMSPVESMACSTPVIGSKEGGILETIIDGETGKLIDITSHELGIIRLKNTIVDTPHEDWLSMKEKSRQQSEKFSLEKFRLRLESLL